MSGVVFQEETYQVEIDYVEYQDGTMTRKMILVERLDQAEARRLAQRVTTASTAVFPYREGSDPFELQKVYLGTSQSRFLGIGDIYMTRTETRRISSEVFLNERA